MTTRISLIILLITTFAAAGEPANTCADPYWKATLRCTLFPNETPQPNLQETPSVGKNAELPKFTRVFLDADPDVRCTDGSPLSNVDARRRGEAQTPRVLRCRQRQRAARRV